MREANETCYAAVRGELQTLFGALCGNKTADLVMAGAKVNVHSWVSSSEMECLSRQGTVLKRRGYSRLVPHPSRKITPKVFCSKTR